jgi:hypothetical protein
MVSTVPPRSTTGRPPSGFVIGSSGYFLADERPLLDHLSGLVPLSVIAVWYVKVWICP